MKIRLVGAETYFAHAPKTVVWRGVPFTKMHLLAFRTVVVVAAQIQRRIVLANFV